MSFKFTELQRPAGDEYWIPFEASIHFTTRWWCRQAHGSHRFFQMFLDGTEVGRIELDNKVGVQHYGVTADVETRALQIEFIEVSSEYRREQIATQMIREIETRHPTQTLVAYSMNADYFWASLGWRRYDSPVKRGPKGSPLFVQQ